MYLHNKTWFLIISIFLVIFQNSTVYLVSFFHYLTPVLAKKLEITTYEIINTKN